MKNGHFSVKRVRQVLRERVHIYIYIIYVCVYEYLCMGVCGYIMGVVYVYIMGIVCVYGVYVCMGVYMYILYGCVCVPSILPGHPPSHLF